MHTYPIHNWPSSWNRTAGTDIDQTSSQNAGRGAGLAKTARPGVGRICLPRVSWDAYGVSLQAEGGYLCPACQKVYPIADGIPHFIETQILSGLNKRFSQMYDWFSWGYRAFSKVAFAYIGMTEEQARREVQTGWNPRAAASWKCPSARV